VLIQFSLYNPNLFYPEFVAQGVHTGCLNFSLAHLGFVISWYDFNRVYFVTSLKFSLDLIAGNQLIEAYNHNFKKV